ncbi:DUF4178 domain-containing protein [Virgibacillus halodenitrificans]|uniref:DUF4178 domain-containing protein n=1 Tax=Virgibacillus halodenitrificans TaxID=1482 RepID=A0AAC9IYM9_VIRHA|nr:DUF4178 domain-containing protein [Virgibacillus halodenitrificans]APC48017.1 hypothetical protein BME96_07450 [Virgibacillus halodenitrificans]MBD1223917.1 DUF4178 domain-containing protein [Virgibacillus halodenitrificans]MCG1027786.1 DUF4178 domain-containing protein [Virgibacillus halodenitrificans]MCJ0931760.1 DUF4178 domain-containing protein [Virgibacillus halodenitrificans]MYL57942.1 DUF4178 domain-containing protein [Virgibacillus halodenitrificans]
MGFFSKLFSSKKDKPEVKERTALTIQVGDIVTYDLVDYEVVGKITYRDGGYEWLGYQLLEGNNTIWLSAEMDDELELGIYKKIQLPVSIPYPKEISYENRKYYLEESGKANVVGEGRSANINGTQTHYADYSDSEEEHFLSFETWGTETEASYGYPIEEFELKILAGTI